MPTEVIMPKVDMDMASGKIMTWHIAEGKAVAKGEPLFDIETDKAAMEIEAPANGILHHTAPEGTEILIGTPCAWLYSEDEEVGEQPKPFARAGGGAEEATTDAGGTASLSADDEADSTEDETDEAASPSHEASVDHHASSGDKIRATPRARVLAVEKGVDIAEISGSGPRGRVQADDVHDALKAPALPEGQASGPVSFSRETGTLAVTRSKGGNGTPIVLVHGFASDATSWAPLEKHLKHRPLIRIELPSHGKSPKLGIDSFSDLVKTMRRTFEALDLEQAHLVGHSLGGAACMALADTRPKRVASLTLIAPAGLGPDINGSVIGGICKATRPESLAPWLRALVSDEDIITDSYVRLAMTGRSEANLRSAQTALAGVLFPDGVQAFDLRAALDRLDRPCRIIWGKRDAIIPWKHALRAPGKIGLHLFDGIGHMPQIECTDAVGEILKNCV